MKGEGQQRKSNHDLPYAIFGRHHDRPYVFGDRNSDCPASSIQCQIGRYDPS